MSKIKDITNTIKEARKKYKLQEDDFFVIQDGIKDPVTIIRRKGIEKILRVEKITYILKVITCQKDYAAVFIDAKKKDGDYIQTTASASMAIQKINPTDGTRYFSGGSTTSAYVLETAEKRAVARAVLKLTDLYLEDWFSEDEKEEWQIKN